MNTFWAARLSKLYLSNEADDLDHNLYINNTKPLKSNLMVIYTIYSVTADLKWTANSYMMTLLQYRKDKHLLIRFETI